MAGGGALAGTLASPAATPADLDGMFRALSDRIETERGSLAWLRSRPTGTRRSLIVAAALPLAALAVATSGLRPDL
ncbi:hypothetical protein ACX0FC_16395, partial [Enterococcus faecium]